MRLNILCSWTKWPVADWGFCPATVTARKCGPITAVSGKDKLLVIPAKDFGELSRVAGNQSLWIPGQPRDDSLCERKRNLYL